MKRIFTWPRAILLFIAVTAFAAWWVPKLSADRYREPIHTALENALGRKVRIGTVKFSLLPVPGFTVRDVIIGEDPAIGPEPIAYVTLLRARPTIFALFGGQLSFASVDLEDTSVNLTRVDKTGGEVRWNFSSLMSPKLLATFPNIHMTGGRVNFKFGDTKSIFYLLNTDVDLWPPDGADDPWTLKVRAEPARTDRPSRGFAAFTARGQWSAKTRTITLDTKLEKSELGDIVTLFEGYESNVHGHIAGSAHLAGPLDRVGIAGRFAIDEIHGWNQTPPGGGAWPLNVSGAIDVPGQVIALRALIAGSEPSPLDLRYRVAGYLGRPHWAVNAIFKSLPIAPIATMARNLGLPVPRDMALEGTADGAVGYAYGDHTPRMDGGVRIVNPALRFADAPSLKVPELNLLFDGTHVNMPAVVLTNEANETASLQWNWDAATQDIQARLSSTGMSIASLRRQLGAASVPLVGRATSGTWSGSLENQTDKEGWSGEVHLKDTVLPLEAFSEPLQLKTADAFINGADFRMKHMNFKLGPLEGEGGYQYDAALPRPHHFHLAFDDADATVIERLLMPALHRGTFLNYAFNFGRVPEPDWMQALHADGTVQIAELTMAGQTLANVKGRALWDGSDVHLAQLEGSIDDAALAGVGDIDLSQRQPRYTVRGHLSGLPWQKGTVAGEGTFETSGTGSDLLSNMTGKGSWRGRSVDIGPGAVWDLVEGCFEWAAGRLQLTQLVMTRGHDTYTGTAESRNGAPLDVRVSNAAGKELHATGALLNGEQLKLALP